MSPCRHSPRPISWPSNGARGRSPSTSGTRAGAVDGTEAAEFGGQPEGGQVGGPLGAGVEPGDPGVTSFDVVGGLPVSAVTGVGAETPDPGRDQQDREGDEDCGDHALRVRPVGYRGPSNFCGRYR